TMKLAEEDKEEFILMMPYTPKKRQNMIAWMGVRNDGENYGDMFVYRFPKQKNVYGPQQIENRINQDSYISQQLNLWSQGGDRKSTRLNSSHVSSSYAVFCLKKNSYR